MISCRLCHSSQSVYICPACTSKSTSVTLADFHELNVELESIRNSMVNYLNPSTQSHARICNLELELRNTKEKVRLLEHEMLVRRYRVSLLKDAVEEIEAVHDYRRNRFTPKEENRVSLTDFLSCPAKFEDLFSALHPFKKFRSLSHSLGEERRLASMAILSMFRFRFINIQAPSRGLSPSDHGIPSIELVGDFDALDGTPDQMHVVLLFVVPVLIALSRIIDTPVPFPVVYGTLVSSPNLHSPFSALEAGCPPYPRILHAFRRVLSPICTTQGVAEQPPVVFKTSVDLLNENLRYLASRDGTITVPLTITDPVAILSYIVITPDSSQSPIMSPRLPPSSPPRQPRKTVIEQSVAEGGEWTLLDQL